jgi:hypothetical protein
MMLEEWWRDFATKVGLTAPEVSRVQYTETRRAFYAGIATLFDKLEKLVTPGTDEPTEADMALMWRINDELAAYVKDLQRGRG